MTRAMCVYDKFITNILLINDLPRPLPSSGIRNQFHLCHFLIDRKVNGDKL